MTTRLFPVSANSQLLVTSQFQKGSSRRSRKSQSKQEARKSIRSESEQSSQDTQDTLWKALLETMPIGVMLLTESLDLFYQNVKAKQISDRFTDSLVEQLCQRLLEESIMIPEPLVMEYQGGMNQFFRLQVRWFNLAEQRFLLVSIEDCYASLQDEASIEQAKYDLTDREAEVWFLIRQKYSYQEISEQLNISLNTVKTHVKNVYSKRKSLAGEQKIWYSR